ncbi:tRNA (adenosine(37)-N6)-threonylcarbamoyltransferase complex dimerization subunit type 1 TsaB [Nostocoides sp. F2B08]|nr:tRNA (adenosine(37)-N6)-threonylcarbamoyltransferase complex dimerization subunit type 1 TsaB [Tetrasphaera sp. F2B08]KAB7743577.1 tRNA (adenosine(37)-N6)-threonylcarbamoyltransferase complex dimerization subunit type 1 TsaB [Tetrasphaera sp. F2B08]
MIMLALDTSTSAITVAVHDGEQVLAERSVLDARAHTEHLAPLVQDALESAGLRPADLTDIAVGVGPGPFTGLRVGLVTARVLAYTVGVPCHGVVSLDALAEEAVRSGSVDGTAEFAVATDARRKEVYWSRYTVTAGHPARLSDPAVLHPADVADGMRGLATAGRGPLLYPDVFASPVTPLDVSAVALAEVALRQIAHGVEVGVDALYLRRPDAQPTSSSKSTLTEVRGDRR